MDKKLSQLLELKKATRTFDEDFCLNPQGEKKTLFFCYDYSSMQTKFCANST